LRQHCVSGKQAGQQGRGACTVSIAEKGSFLKSQYNLVSAYVNIPANSLKVQEMKFTPLKRPRHLILVLGDQLDPGSAAFDDFDPSVDAVWMAEVSEEATYVWSHKARIAIFLSAMRHFCQALRRRGIFVHYSHVDDPKNKGGFGAELKRAIQSLKPKRLIVVEPGEWRVRQNLVHAAKHMKTPLELRPDHHFLVSHKTFAKHAQGRKQLRMEFFYRQVRRETGILMSDNEPEGGKWNYDTENRGYFTRRGPGKIPPPLAFTPDGVTQDVIHLVEKKFSDHPGALTHFDWPVTPQQASLALKDFVTKRLHRFGPYQDAMWSGEPYLFHSRLSSSMNLKLLDPRSALQAAETAYEEGLAPLNSVEGFVRQILGWREYVRGIYWHFMPGYKTLNALEATLPLPHFYWTGETDMNCLRETIGQTLEYGFSHHIQRLMVTGLFALLLGAEPQEVHKWYLAIYVDAVEWVELPNTLGMSQFADGGIMASKPYVATGQYIQRMSNYCSPCRFDPATSVGDDACPVTTLYWDFLMRHDSLLRHNVRMQLQIRNLSRLSTEQRRAIRRQAKAIQKRTTS
jgi:deoxyribodipyrimidine photolyase-related protein